jgi:hypothetical protein
MTLLESLLNYDRRSVRKRLQYCASEFVGVQPQNQTLDLAIFLTQKTDGYRNIITVFTNKIGFRPVSRQLHDCSGLAKSALDACAKVLIWLLSIFKINAYRGHSNNT